MRLDKASGLNESTTGTLRTLHFHPSPALLGWKCIRWGWGCAWGLLSAARHPCRQFPWVLLVVTNQLQWVLLRQIILVQCSPTIHRGPHGWQTLGGSREVVGGRLRVSAWPQALYCHALPFLPWSFLLIILSVICLQLPRHHLDIDTFLILSVIVLFLIMWVRASSTLLRVCVVLTTRPVRGLVTVKPAPITCTQRDCRISNQCHEHIGEFKFSAPLLIHF